MSSWDEMYKNAKERERREAEKMYEMQLQSYQSMAGLASSNAYQAQKQAYEMVRNALMQGYGLSGPMAPAAPSKPYIDPAKLAALKSAEPRIVTAAMPDSIVPLAAWRAWRVTSKLNGAWSLKALGQDGLWEPKKMMEAKCTAGKDHPAPHRDCNCGIWSFRTLEELLEALKAYSEVPVIGQVSIWGRVLECENGFRSQFAYPKELWLMDETMEQLGYAYGVPIRTVK